VTEPWVLDEKSKQVSGRPDLVVIHPEFPHPREEIDVDLVVDR